MIVDAAGSLLSSSAEIPPTPAKPNNRISSGQVIINYVEHFINAANSDTLDYLLISHFHPDHIGNYSASLPLAGSGNFRMGGVTEVGAKIPFKIIIDRGYPNYDYPRNISSSDLMSNYIKFINWAKTSYNAKAEQFGVGESNQIVLRRNPSRYNNFEVRNIVANGKVWAGNGTGITNTFPPVEELVASDPNENIFSIGFHLSYGQFNYFAGGDLQYNNKSAYSWNDIETPVSVVMPQVDVMKANHHGTKNCNGQTFLNRLSPHVVVVNTWRDVQPNPETIGRMYAVNNNCKIFTTNMTDDNKVRLDEYIPKINSTQGHIVVRVKPGGQEYYVYILDDTNEDYLVKNVFGPYQSN
jgi:beta-lactamase superfamily II metal-dependent hydrolase